MPTTSTLTSELSARGAAKPLAAAFRAAFEAFRAYRARRLAMHSLYGLDDHILRDIGLTRSEIGSVVYGDREERMLGFDDDED
jgi:uncharacterized protein YjiS (DUF1127 family)